MTTSDALSNACTRAADVVNDAFHKGDWDEWRRWFADDVTLDDRRLGLGHAATGPDEALGYVKALSDVGIERVVWTPIATRGDRLAAFRTSAISTDGFEVERLVVSAVDADGKFGSHVFLDCDEFDAALDELDNRYADGEGATYADILRAARRLRSSVNRRDWRAFHGVLTDDFVLVDHRPASLGQMTAERWAESMRALFELIPSWHASFVRFIALDTDRYLAFQLNAGSTEDGGPMEWVMLDLGHIREDRLERVELFSVDRSETALARFEELGVTSSG